MSIWRIPCRSHQWKWLWPCPEQSALASQWVSKMFCASKTSWLFSMSNIDYTPACCKSDPFWIWIGCLWSSASQCQEKSSCLIRKPSQIFHWKPPPRPPPLPLIGRLWKSLIWFCNSIIFTYNLYASITAHGPPPIACPLLLASGRLYYYFYSQDLFMLKHI